MAEKRKDSKGRVLPQAPYFSIPSSPPPDPARNHRTLQSSYRPPSGSAVRPSCSRFFILSLYSVYFHKNFRLRRSQAGSPVTVQTASPAKSIIAMCPRTHFYTILRSPFTHPTAEAENDPKFNLNGKTAYRAKLLLVNGPAGTYNSFISITEHRKREEEKMHMRKQMKADAKKVLKRHYFLFLLLCLTASLLGGELVMSRTAGQNITEDMTPQTRVTFTDAIVTSFFDIVMDVASGKEEERKQQIQEAEERYAAESPESGTEIFGRSRGVLASAVNKLLSGAYLMT